MLASEGDGAPWTAASRSEEQEQAHTPVSSRAGVSAFPASESSLAGSAPEGQVDEESPVSRRDLARTRRAIGTSLKSMHEEFTGLLMSTQQECSTRITAFEAVLIKDREVTKELIKLESQKREALEKQLEGRDEAPRLGPVNPTTSPSPVPSTGTGPSMLEELLNSRISALVEAVRVGLDDLRVETTAVVDSLSDNLQTKVQVLEETILAVNAAAQELSEKMAKDLESHQEGSDPWSDWRLLECFEFLGLWCCCRINLSPFE